ncbi:MAG: LamG-like jellyroll fold domain-containing protein [Streptosporangiaceae bacterium]
MPVDDQAHAKVVTATSAPGSAKLRTWTQLTAVYESAHGTLTLYVNGVQAGQSGDVGRWLPGDVGRVRIGNGLPGGPAHDWSGQLSNACVFYGPLSQPDVSVLYQGDAAHPKDGCAALYATYP